MILLDCLHYIDIVYSTKAGNDASIFDELSMEDAHALGDVDDGSDITGILLWLQLPPQACFCGYWYVSMVTGLSPLVCLHGYRLVSVVTGTSPWLQAYFHGYRQVSIVMVSGMSPCFQACLHGYELVYMFSDMYTWLRACLHGYMCLHGYVMSEIKPCEEHV